MRPRRPRLMRQNRLLVLSFTQLQECARGGTRRAI
jgi:hypothetical protein